MKSQIVLIVVLYTVLAQCLVLAVRAYPTLNERLPALKVQKHSTHSPPISLLNLTYSF